MELGPRSPQAPTLPSRHSYRRLYPQRPPTLPDTLSALIPPPLCINKTPQTQTYSPATTTTIIHVTVLEAPDFTPPPTQTSNPNPQSSQSPSPNPSTPSSSAPTSPTSRPTAWTYDPAPPYPLFASAPPPPWYRTCPLDAAPHGHLRRKTSPRRETLRALRVRDSEMSLRRVYDERTAVYLHGAMFVRPGLSSLEDGG